MTEQFIAVVVPALISEPPYSIEFEPTKAWDTFRKLFPSGMVEIIVSQGELTIYGDEEARVQEPPLPPNARANEVIGPVAENYVPITKITHFDEGTGQWVVDQEIRLPGEIGLVCGPAIFAGGTREDDENDVTVQSGLSPNQIALLAYYLQVPGFIMKEV